MSALAWIYSVVAVSTAAVLLFAFGLSFWTALVALGLLTCPAIILWGMFETLRGGKHASDTAPETRGRKIDWLVPIYDSLCKAVGLGWRFRQQTLAFLDPKPGQSVLDVGCGTGELTVLIAERVGESGRAIGLDPGPAMILRARRKADRQGSRALFQLGVAEHLPFEAAQFDRLVMSVVLHHLPGDLKDMALREAGRVLKSDGSLLVLDVDRPAHRLGWLLVWPLLLVPEIRPHLYGCLRPCLERAGFAQVQPLGRWGIFLAFWRASAFASPASAAA
jgi:ubiquinone/menaquinone biosynthesis C-methylase UbiE